MIHLLNLSYQPDLEDPSLSLHDLQDVYLNGLFFKARVSRNFAVSSIIHRLLRVYAHVVKNVFSMSQVDEHHAEHATDPCQDTIILPMSQPQSQYGGHDKRGDKGNPRHSVVDSDPCKCRKHGEKRGKKSYKTKEVCHALAASKPMKNRIMVAKQEE